MENKKSEWQPPDIAPPMKGHRRVVCAAIMLENGKIVLGARHWDKLMHTFASMEERRKFNREKQGFIDQWCRFMDRHEAYRVAQAAGQILYRCGGDEVHGGTLYSENLY